MQSCDVYTVVDGSSYRIDAQQASVSIPHPVNVSVLVQVKEKNVTFAALIKTN